MADVPTLTPEQSEARIAELRAQGYEVEREVQPDGTVVVRKRLPVDWGGALCVLLGLVGCFAFSSSRGRGR
jgi:hypothetical protein